MSKIKDQDISIVVQGPVLTESLYGITSETTKLVCQRVRKVFPNAEIILSVKEGTNTQGIIYDKLVVTPDPGATGSDYYDRTFLNNNNRLIVSTRAGIQAATRKYVLKLRSDLFVVSKSFLNYFDQFPHFDEQYKFVKNRIIAFSLDTIKAHRTCYFIQKRPYHISDWAYFGYKEDMWDLFDIPLAQEPEFSQWFLTRCRPFFDIHPHRLWRMPPEQYITVSFLQKHMDFKFDNMSDLSNDNEELSNKLLTNNFLVLDQTQFCLVSLKYVKLQLLFDGLLSRTAIFYHTWLQDYLIYCKVPKSATWFKYKIQSKYRLVIQRLVNLILLGLNKRFSLVNRCVAALIKLVK